MVWEMDNTSKCTTDRYYGPRQNLHVSRTKEQRGVEIDRQMAIQPAKAFYRVLAPANKIGSKPASLEKKKSVWIGGRG